VPPEGKLVFLELFAVLLGFIKMRLRSGFKTSDQVQGQGASRSITRSIRIVCEHLSEACNAAIGPQMGF